MSTENKIPENILAALEAKKGSIAHIVKTTWEQTKHDDMGPVGNFAKFHMKLMMAVQTDITVAFKLTLGMLADNLLPLLTEEEKEALRNESTNLRK